MCLIVRTEKEKPLTLPLITEFMKKNKDGWGMMWIQNNTMKTEKRHESKPDECFELYDTIKEFNPVIHFRWKTHGAIDPQNTHPFYCGYGIFLMHNGVVHSVGSSTALSDTGHFVKDWMFPLLATVKNPHEFIRSPMFKLLIEDKIGQTNRIILGDRGGYVIFNEKQWHTCTSDLTGIKGTMVSNQYAWEESQYGRPKVTYMPQGSYHGQTGGGTTPVSWGGNKTIRGIISKALSKKERKRLAKQLALQESAEIDAPSGFFPGHINEYGVRNHLGATLSQVVGNIWVNSLGEVWLRWKASFKREAGLDVWAENKLKQQQPAQAITAETSVLTHAPGTSLVATSSSNNDNDIWEYNNVHGIWVPKHEVTVDVTGTEQFDALLALTSAHIPIAVNDPEAGADEEDTDHPDPVSTHIQTLKGALSDKLKEVEEYETYITATLKEYRENSEDIDQLENLCIADGAEAARVIYRLFQNERYLMN